MRKDEGRRREKSFIPITIDKAARARERERIRKREVLKEKLESHTIREWIEEWRTYFNSKLIHTTVHSQNTNTLTSPYKHNNKQKE